MADEQEFDPNQGLDGRGVSEELAQELEAAFHRVLEKHGGAMLTNYVCGVQYIGPDGNRYWATLQDEKYDYVKILGLLRLYTIGMEQQAAAYLRDE